MTFKELKEALEKVPPNQLNQQVFIKHKYGGEWDILHGVTKSPCTMYESSEDGMLYDEYSLDGGTEGLDIILEKGTVYLSKL